MEIIYNPEYIETLKKGWKCKSTAAFHFIVAAYTCLEDMNDYDVNPGLRMCQDLKILQRLEDVLDTIESCNEVKEAT